MSPYRRKLDDTEHLASAVPSNHKMQKLNGAKATAASSSKKPFLFLSLAPELRNKIYSSPLEDYPSRLSNKNDNSQLQTDCPLICVSKQVNSELKSLLVTETTIEAIAHDFDFDHIIAFFENLSEADFEDYVKSTDSSGRVLKVKRIFSVLNPSSLPDAELGQLLRTYDRWTQWVSETERGFALNVIYSWEVDADPSCYDRLNPDLPRLEERKRDERKRTKKERDEKKQKTVGAAEDS